MNVTFEHPTIIFNDSIAKVIIEFVNHILYADSEATLRLIVADFAENYIVFLAPCAVAGVKHLILFSAGSGGCAHSEGVSFWLP